MDRKIDRSVLRRERTRRIAIRTTVVLVIIIAVISIIMTLERGVDASDIRIATAETGPLETTVAASGRVEPAFEEIITSPVSSRILKVFVQPGDTVSAGTPLLQLDLESTRTAYEQLLDKYGIARQSLTQLQLSNRTMLSDLSMQIEVKEILLHGLEIDVENERKLDSIGSGTGERVRQAENTLKASTLELRQLRSKLANETLRAEAAERAAQLELSSLDKEMIMMSRTLEQGRIPAPHSGTVTYVNSGIGSQITAGERIAVVSDLSLFRINGEVPEGSSSRVGLGASVRIRIGATELTGNVSNITPQARGGAVSFTVTPDDPRNTRLKSGLRTEMYVSYGYKDSVIRIPNGPYFKGPGNYTLFVSDRDGTRLRQRDIRLGDSNRDFVEVISGLRPGERVAVSDMEEYRRYSSLKIKHN